MVSTRAKYLCGASLTAAVLLIPSAALAQTGSQDSPAPTKQEPAEQNAGTPAADTIIVTGSRIPRAGFDTVQPAMLVGNQQIEARGYTNAGDALGDLPAFGVAGNSSVGRQSEFTAGQTFVDFFSLGSQRTLTLVNGRRFVSSNASTVLGSVSGGSQVDFNTIPLALVDRIETVAVGGAPIYGSDAIAGTVNVIMKRNFNGVEASAQSGISQQGDGAEYRLSLAAGTGFAGDRGHIAIAGEWNHSDGLVTAARFATSSRGPFYASPTGTSPYDQILYYDQTYNVFTTTGVPLAQDDFPIFAGIRDSQGRILRFSANGQLVPYDMGKPTGAFHLSQGGDGFRLNDDDNLNSEVRRYLGTALGSFQLTSGVRLFGEAWYANSSGTRLRAQPVYSTAAFASAGSPNGNFIFSLDNPYLSAQDRATIASNLDFNHDGKPDQNQFYLARANTDISLGDAKTKVELYRFVGGLDGTFELGGRQMKWEASLNYGRSRSTSTEPAIAYQNLTNALDAVRDASGNIVCRPGYKNAPIATGSATCAPLDLFGFRQASPAALAYITATTHAVQVNTQFVANANLAGSLFTLPAGDVGFALGYEHRRESSRFDPGAFLLGQVDATGARTSYGYDTPVDPVHGSFHTDEVFGELRVPIISPGMQSFINELEFEGAARYVRHSFAGGDLTWTAGGRFAPIRDITFRGNFTRSIRSPSIVEAFNPTSQTSDQGFDPCDSRYINSGPNPGGRAANCRAAGVPQNFTSHFSEHSILVTVSGNPTLKNERANSWTVGAVVRPRFIPNLTIAADYINIRLRNAIVALDGQSILNACYDAKDYPNPFCGRFKRDASGQLVTIHEGFYNAASLDFAGVTAELAYRLPLSGLGLPRSHALISVNYLYVDKLQSQTGSGDINVMRGKFGNPAHSFTANLNYGSDAGLEVLLQVRYEGKSKLDPNAAPNLYQYSDVRPWWLFNGSIGQRINPHLELRLMVDNIFNVHAPFQVTALPGGNNAFFPGIFGRGFRASAKVKF